MEKESKFWSIFGKVSAIVTTIAGLIGIWVVVNKQTEDLELYIESTPYSLNPKLKQDINNNFKAFDISKLESLLESKAIKSTSEKNHKLALLINEYHKESWGTTTERNFDIYDKLVYINIKNSGEKSASDIKIDLPLDGIAFIETSEGTSKILNFNKVISLNDIRAGNNANITIWSDSYMFTRYDYKKINITHGNGIGSVSWPSIATGLSWYFVEYIFLLPVFIYIIFMIGMYIGSRQNNNTKT